jgi:hypothetical protein
MQADFDSELEQMIANKHRVHASEEVRYKILDREDEEFQGLYMEARTISISKKGLILLMKHRVKPEDAMIVELTLGPEKRIIKTCCESIGCRKESFNKGYEVEVQFLILKDEDKQYIESYMKQNSV